MTLSVLEICQEALQEVGVDAPTTLVSGGDLGAQLLALANSTGRDIALRHKWSTLRTEGTFTTLAAEIQVASVKTTFPYLREFIEKSMWNRSQQRRVIGPVSAQAWQRYKSTSASPATSIWYYRGDVILFPGPPDAGDDIYFEYIDTRFVSNAAGSSYYESFQTDTDIPRVDDYAMVLGVRWRFLKKKGLEYGEEFRSYEDYISLRSANDQPQETINLNPHQGSEGFDSQIPEGNWNL